MKKKTFPAIVFIAFMFVMSAALMGCTTNSSPDRTAAAALTPGNAADALRFKEENEALNGQLRDSGQPHLEIYIPANNRVVYLEFDELMDFFDSGTGVFFFSRPACPWCRVLLPTLLEVAEVTRMYLHFYDIEYDRSAHNENYIRILKALDNYLPVDDRSQSPDDPDFDETLKRVTVPHLFFLQDGVVVSEAMMNRHPLLYEEDFAGLYSFLLEMFRQIPSEHRAAPCTEDC